MQDGSETAMDIMKSSIRQLMEEHADDRLIGIGVATPGPFVRNEGRIILMTEFPGWEKIHIIDELKKAFSLPVVVEHDANCSVVAEWWLGKHRRNSGTMMAVIAGQGIGAGVMVDGRLLVGSMGIAGEIGHMSIDCHGERCKCGNRGCLYKYCSSITLVKEVNAQIAEHPGSVLNRERGIDAIYKAIREGDGLAVKVLDKAAWYLGFGLANAVNAYNPDVIIICDEMIQSGPRLLDKVKEAIREHVMPELYERLTVEYSEIGGDTSLLGASHAVVSKVLSRPSALMA
jgi:predicted NBD/HSP70 family sugar kinase